MKTNPTAPWPNLMFVSSINISSTRRWSNTKSSAQTIMAIFYTKCFNMLFSKILTDFYMDKWNQVLGGIHSNVNQKSACQKCNFCCTSDLLCLKKIIIGYVLFIHPFDVIFFCWKANKLGRRMDPNFIIKAEIMFCE